MVEEGPPITERPLGKLGERIGEVRSIINHQVEAAALQLARDLPEFCGEAKKAGIFPKKFVSLGDHTGKSDSIPLIIVGFREVPPEHSYFRLELVVLTEEGQLFVCNKTAWMGTSEPVADFRPSHREQLTPDSPDYLKYGLMALGKLEELIREKNAK